MFERINGRCCSFSHLGDFEIIFGKKKFLCLEREYQCLGQWEEDGQLLAHVMRIDVPNRFECFVGATDDEGQIFLIESGTNCLRSLRVTQSGMKLNKESKSVI
jgi:hypothetical protein